MSESCSPVSPVRIAVIQYDPQVGLEHCERNLGRGLALARRAAGEGANLIVLPELANTGYTFNSRAEAYDHAETLQDGPSLKAWEDFARQYQVYLAAGFSERDGLKLYDSAVLLGPEGRLGHYRKAHLWNQEKLWFTPGDLGVPGIRDANRAYRPAHMLGHLVPRSTAADGGARRRYHLQPQQLGMDPATIVR